MSDKIPVIVFLPVGVCGCSQTSFLGRVYNAVKKHRTIVEYKEHSAENKIAKRYGVGFRGVVVGDELVGSNPTAAAIEEAILKEAEKLGVEIV